MTTYTPEEIYGSSYGYQPNLPANLVALVLFFILFVVHSVLSCYYRQWVLFVSWFIGLTFQFIGYIGRVVSHFKLFDQDAFVMQLALLIISPALFMIGVYYQLAKLVTIYGKRFSPLPPMGYSAIFITCDWISIFVQAAGGGIASTGSTNRDPHEIDTGGYVMVGGLAFQALAMVLFIGLFAVFLWQVNSASEEDYDPQWAHIRRRPLFKYFIPSLCITTLFIFIRSIYRVIELSGGWNSRLVQTERYFLILDGLMILISVTSMTVIHPGLVLGREPIPVQHIKFGKKRDLGPDPSVSESVYRDKESPAVSTIA